MAQNALYLQRLAARQPGGSSYVPPEAPQPYLPGVSWATSKSSPVASRNDINAVSSTPQDTQAQVAAENAPLRVIYGRCRLGAQVADALTYQNDLIMLLVWGDGEIQEIESVTVGDETPAAGITLTHYLGTAAQTADATLVAAYASHGITYADNLPDIAYSVARVPVGTTNGFPTFQAIIKGRKLYDPRLDSTAGGSGTQRKATPSTWTYSDNPALATADFESSTLYGRGRTVNAASLIAAANFCDELCGTEKRRIIGLVIDNIAPPDQWLEALRTYAGCFAPREGSETVLIPDAPGSVEVSFSDSVAPKIKANSLKLKKRGVLQVPTVMEVRYTDTSVTPWAERSAIVKADGVDAGTTPRRESQVSLPGITRYSQAYREAVERMNKLTLSDLSADFVAFDEALKVNVGMIIDITHPIGLTAKQARVMAAQIVEPGRYAISALEYDPAAYSDSVEATPTYSDTALPSPASPPAILGLTLVEEIYQLQDGTYSSRIRTTWTAAVYPYLKYYRAEIWSNEVLIYSAQLEGTDFPSPPVQEGSIYSVRVQVVSDVGAAGTWASGLLTAQGKQLPPGDVPSVTGYEVGGEVYLAWPPAIDIDIWKYELRYGPTTGTWETATLIDRIDALRYRATGIAAGLFRFYVKALDSVLNYSTSPAYCDVTVSLDTNAFLVDTFSASAPVLEHMTAYTLRADANTYYITDFGDGFGYGADNTDNAVGTFGDSLVNVVLASPHTAGTSAWTSDSFDAGQSLTGNWMGVANYSDLVGTAELFLELSDDDITYTRYGGLSVFATARYARIRVETTGAMKVTLSGNTIRLNVVAKTETATITTSLTGPATVLLAGQYVKVKTIQLTPVGIGNKTAVPDNIVVGVGGYVLPGYVEAGYVGELVNSYDVYSYTDGVRTADTVNCLFQGV